MIFIDKFILKGKDRAKYCWVWVQIDFIYLRSFNYER